MPVGMNVRHVKARLRQETREKVYYAADMQEGVGSPSYTTLGNSPVWTMATGADRTLYLDVKDPIDRVANTPVRFKIVYALTVAAGGVVAFIIEYNVVGEGGNLAPAVTPIMYEFDAGPIAINRQKTTLGVMYIWQTALDPPQQPNKSLDMQLELGIDGNHAGHTTLGTVNLLKVIMEYTAWT